MSIRVHPRVNRVHPEIEDADAVAAFTDCLRAVPREGTGFPPQWVGVGLDGKGRLLQFVAINEGPDQWLIFHTISATTRVLRDLGLRR